MSLTDAGFAEVVAGLAAGDQDAARVIYERFVHRLVALAARRLDRRLGAKVDPESAAHSAFESFFAGVGGGAVRVESWEGVYGLLAHITFRKCLNRNRDLRRQKRHPGAGAAEVGLADWEPLGGQPTPAEEAAVAELLGLALADFDPDERAILDGVLAGQPNDRVAEHVGLSTRTVQRVVERFRGRLEALLAG